MTTPTQAHAPMRPNLHLTLLFSETGVDVATAARLLRLTLTRGHPAKAGQAECDPALPLATAAQMYTTRLAHALALREGTLTITALEALEAGVGEGASAPGTTSVTPAGGGGAAAAAAAAAKRRPGSGASKKSLSNASTAGGTSDEVRRQSLLEERLPLCEVVCVPTAAPADPDVPPTPAATPTTTPILFIYELRDQALLLAAAEGKGAPVEAPPVDWQEVLWRTIDPALERWQQQQQQLAESTGAAGGPPPALTDLAVVWAVASPAMLRACIASDAGASAPHTTGTSTTTTAAPEEPPAATTRGRSASGGRGSAGSVTATASAATNTAAAAAAATTSALAPTIDRAPPAPRVWRRLLHPRILLYLNDTGFADATEPDGFTCFAQQLGPTTPPPSHHAQRRASSARAAAAAAAAGGGGPTPVAPTARVDEAAYLFSSGRTRRQTLSASATGGASAQTAGTRGRGGAGGGGKATANSTGAAAVAPSSDAAATTGGGGAASSITDPAVLIQTAATDFVFLDPRHPVPLVDTVLYTCTSFEAFVAKAQRFLYQQRYVQRQRAAVFPLTACATRLLADPTGTPRLIAGPVDTSVDAAELRTATPLELCMAADARPPPSLQDFAAYLIRRRARLAEISQARQQEQQQLHQQQQQQQQQQGHGGSTGSRGGASTAGKRGTSPSSGRGKGGGLGASLTAPPTALDNPPSPRAEARASAAAAREMLATVLAECAERERRIAASAEPPYPPAEPVWHVERLRTKAATLLESPGSWTDLCVRVLDPLLASLATVVDTYRCWWGTREVIPLPHSRRLAGSEGGQMVGLTTATTGAARRPTGLSAAALRARAGDGERQPSTLSDGGVAHEGSSAAALLAGAAVYHREKLLDGFFALPTAAQALISQAAAVLSRRRPLCFVRPVDPTEPPRSLRVCVTTTDTNTNTNTNTDAAAADPRGGRFLRSYAAALAAGHGDGVGTASTLVHPTPVTARLHALAVDHACDRPRPPPFAEEVHWLAEQFLRRGVGRLGPASASARKLKELASEPRGGAPPAEAVEEEEARLLAAVFDRMAMDVGDQLASPEASTVACAGEPVDRHSGATTATTTTTASAAAAAANSERVRAVRIAELLERHAARLSATSGATPLPLSSSTRSGGGGGGLEVRSPPDVRTEQLQQLLARSLTPRERGHVLQRLLHAIIAEAGGLLVPEEGLGRTAGCGGAVEERVSLVTAASRIAAFRARFGHHQTSLLSLCAEDGLAGAEAEAEAGSTTPAAPTSSSTRVRPTSQLALAAENVYPPGRAQQLWVCGLRVGKECGGEGGGPRVGQMLWVHAWRGGLGLEQHRGCLRWLAELAEKDSRSSGSSDRDDPSQRGGDHGLPLSVRRELIRSGLTRETVVLPTAGGSSASTASAVAIPFQSSHHALHVAAEGRQAFYPYANAMIEVVTYAWGRLCRFLHEHEVLASLHYSVQEGAMMATATSPTAPRRESKHLTVRYDDGVTLTIAVRPTDASTTRSAPGQGAGSSPSPGKGSGDPQALGSAAAAGRRSSTMTSTASPAACEGLPRIVAVPPAMSSGANNSSTGGGGGGRGTGGYAPRPPSVGRKSATGASSGRPPSVHDEEEEADGGAAVLLRGLQRPPAIAPIGPHGHVRLSAAQWHTVEGCEGEGRPRDTLGTTTIVKAMDIVVTTPLFALSCSADTAAARGAGVTAAAGRPPSPEAVGAAAPHLSPDVMMQYFSFASAPAAACPQPETLRCAHVNAGPTTPLLPSTELEVARTVRVGDGTVVRRFASGHTQLLFADGAVRTTFRRADGVVETLVTPSGRCFVRGVPSPAMSRDAASAPSRRPTTAASSDSDERAEAAEDTAAESSTFTPLHVRYAREDRYEASTDCHVSSREDGVTTATYAAPPLASGGFAAADEGGVRCTAATSAGVRVVVHADGTAITTLPSLASAEQLRAFMRDGSGSGAARVLEPLLEDVLAVQQIVSTATSDRTDAEQDAPSAVPASFPPRWCVESSRMPRVFLFAPDEDDENAMTSARVPLYVRFADGTGLLRRPLAIPSPVPVHACTPAPAAPPTTVWETSFTRPTRTTVRLLHESCLATLEPADVYARHVATEYRRLPAIAVGEGLAVFDLADGGLRYVDAHQHVTSVSKLFAAHADVEASMTAAPVPWEQLLRQFVAGSYSPHRTPRRPTQAAAATTTATTTRTLSSQPPASILSTTTPAAPPPPAWAHQRLPLVQRLRALGEGYVVANGLLRPDVLRRFLHDEADRHRPLSSVGPATAVAPRCFVRLVSGEVRQLCEEGQVQHAIGVAEAESRLLAAAASATVGADEAHLLVRSSHHGGLHHPGSRRTDHEKRDGECVGGRDGARASVVDGGGVEQLFLYRPAVGAGGGGAAGDPMNPTSGGEGGGVRSRTLRAQLARVALLHTGTTAGIVGHSCRWLPPVVRPPPSTTTSTTTTTTTTAPVTALRVFCRLPPIAPAVREFVLADAVSRAARLRALCDHHAMVQALPATSAGVAAATAVVEGEDGWAVGRQHEGEAVIAAVEQTVREAARAEQQRLRRLYYAMKEQSAEPRGGG